MILIIKTKDQILPADIYDRCIDYRYLGKSQFDEHYHEINTRLLPHKIATICFNNPSVIDYAFDCTEYKNRGLRDFKLLYQEIQPASLLGV